MIEILLLFRYCKLIGVKAREKGRRAFGYQLMLVLFWIGGEIVAGIAAGLGFMMYFGEQGFDDNVFFIYLAGIAGAVIGACLAFWFVRNLPDVSEFEPESQAEDDQGYD